MSTAGALPLAVCGESWLARRVSGTRCPPSAALRCFVSLCRALAARTRTSTSRPMAQEGLTGRRCRHPRRRPRRRPRHLLNRPSLLPRLRLHRHRRGYHRCHRARRVFLRPRHPRRRPFPHHRSPRPWSLHRRARRFRGTRCAPASRQMVCCSAGTSPCAPPPSPVTVSQQSRRRRRSHISRVVSSCKLGEAELSARVGGHGLPELV